MNVNDFKYMTRFVPDETKRALMLRKGVYPYDYMTSMDKFDETQLPPHSAFYNDLLMNHFQTKTTNLHSGYGQNLDVEPYETTTIYI